jgi:hypothetical protein
MKKHMEPNFDIRDRSDDQEWLTPKEALRVMKEWGVTSATRKKQAEELEEFLSEFEDAGFDFSIAISLGDRDFSVMKLPRLVS